MKKAASLIFSLCLATTACIRHHNRLVGGPPEEVVREFVMLSANSKGLSDKQALQELCAGSMKNAFEKMTDEVFRISYLNAGLKVRDLKILETETRGDNARVHYKVVVENPHGTDPTQETNEREVDLLHEQGQWLIETVRGQGSDQIVFTRGMIF